MTTTKLCTSRSAIQAIIGALKSKTQSKTKYIRFNHDIDTDNQFKKIKIKINNINYDIEYKDNIKLIGYNIKDKRGLNLNDHIELRSKQEKSDIPLIRYLKQNYKSLKERKNIFVSRFTQK